MLARSSNCITLAKPEQAFQGREKNWTHPVQTQRRPPSQNELKLNTHRITPQTLACTHMLFAQPTRFPKQKRFTPTKPKPNFVKQRKPKRRRRAADEAACTRTQNLPASGNGGDDGGERNPSLTPNSRWLCSQPICESRKSLLSAAAVEWGQLMSRIEILA